MLLSSEKSAYYKLMVYHKIGFLDQAVQNLKKNAKLGEET